jgi:DNA-binding protein H-NS
MSKKLNLDAMSIDKMWKLHEEISRVLSARLMTEKRQLEKRLAQLFREKEMRQLEPKDTQSLNGAPRGRRKYPRKALISNGCENSEFPNETRI